MMKSIELAALTLEVPASGERTIVFTDKNIVYLRAIRVIVPAKGTNITLNLEARVRGYATWEAIQTVATGYNEVKAIRAEEIRLRATNANGSAVESVRYIALMEYDIEPERMAVNSITPVMEIKKALAGGLTLAATLIEGTLFIEPEAGAIEPTGAVVADITRRHAVAGAIEPAGAVTMAIARTSNLDGGLAMSGNLTLDPQ